MRSTVLQQFSSKLLNIDISHWAPPPTVTSNKHTPATRGPSWRRNGAQSLVAREYAHTLQKGNTYMDDTACRPHRGSARAELVRAFDQ